MGDLLQFERDLDAFGQAIGVAPADLARQVAFKLFAKIVERTPVDTGRAAASWNISINEPDRTVQAESYHNPGGAASAAQEKLTALPANGPTERIWISNNVPYILVLEHGGYPDPVKHGTRVKGHAPVQYEVRSIGGFSTQAPHGMAALSLADMDLEIATQMAAVGLR